MKFIKLILTALAVSCLSVLVVFAWHGVTFSDVEEGGWYEQAVHDMNLLGIINGYGDGTFGPENSVTRAEFAVMF